MEKISNKRSLSPDRGNPILRGHSSSSSSSSDEHKETTNGRTKAQANSVKRPKHIRKFLVKCKLKFADLPLADFKARKFLDVRRWQCIARPQHPNACSITSVVAVWNYLYSNAGNGNLPLITPEAALKILGFIQKIDYIPFAQIAGNATIMGWFEKLCAHFKVRGKASIFWKRDVTAETSDQLLQKYVAHIRSPKKAFLYHCQNHYCVPIGFDIVPFKPCNAYISRADKDTFEPWIVVGESAKSKQGMYVVRWEAVGTDIMSDDFYFYDVRRPRLGLQLKQKRGKNLHCLILVQAN